MSEQKEEEIIVRDKWHGCPNSFCPACVNARKDTDHIGCTAVKLYVMKDGKGEPFLKFPEYHCVCFKKNPKLHYLIASQLKPEDIKPFTPAFKPRQREEYKVIKIDPDETNNLFEDQQQSLD